MSTKNTTIMRIFYTMSLNLEKLVNFEISWLGFYFEKK